MSLVAYYDPPPIPLRSFDWYAYDADDYEPGRPLGIGPTREAAEADWRSQVEEDT